MCSSDLKDGRAPAHESPKIMLIPLVLLATGAVAAGFVFKPQVLTSNADNFWQGAIVRDSDPMYGPHGVHPFGAATATHAPAAEHAVEAPAAEHAAPATAEAHAPAAEGEHAEAVDVGADVDRATGERLLAVESVNQPADHMAGRRLLTSRTAITPAQAADMASRLYGS